LPTDLKSRGRILRRYMPSAAVAAILGEDPADVAAVRANPAAAAPAGDSPIVVTKSIDTDELVTGNVYAAMPTPDRVAAVDAPRGMILVMYQALWRRTTASSQRFAALFLNGTQLKGTPAAGGAVVAQELSETSAHTFWNVLHSAPGTTALNSSSTPTSDQQFDSSGPMAHGVVGSGNGAALLIVPPGSYTVEVRFKVTAGDVHVKQRRLSAWGV
jgi:hypothetical protein